MNWSTARTWVMANLRIAIPAIGFILFSGYLLFGGNSPDSNVPGGGFGTFIVSGLIFWGAYRVGTGATQKVLGTMATLLLIVWAWPRFFPFLIYWTYLLIAVNCFWIYKKGLGVFFWRLAPIILLISILFYSNDTFKKSYDGFIKFTGIEFKMPEVEMPEVVKNAATGFAKYMKNLSAQKISQSKERLVKNGSTFYNYDGTNFAKKDVSEKNEFIKVFILDEQVTKGGLTFEKVRIGDPATGEDAWVYSGILLTSPTATPPPPVLKPEGSAPEWEKVADCPIHFVGRVFDNRVGPNGERPNTGEVYSGCFVEVGYEYKITFSGDYSQFFKHLPWYKKLSWSGWNPQIQDAIKPFPNYNYGALMLRIGAQNGLHPEKGKNFITFTPTDPAKILGELNITQREDSYIDQSSVGNKIQDSTLSIKIERRPL
ncbi:MAG: hypothetical protein UR66_C0009G0100 [Candidatus Moranbacteria bacterium GW2011_GWE1_35_17]|nr:MAG: hypothetical protein UR65_C0077G0006 [Candidatus Moranbacteria bacterium GW2011_GWE2_35_164]KKP68010.1 MAG: hypothetical protein UR66_C0009G0100 [Candidatus Moranbacteria bacterium GW2011_GWE1_35_17]KKP82302.1 MAG: hypothetical protein UR82_C0040G0011 [Candidatus Moranbacteria bacterium GW2011_GWF1_35_5]KKP82437.1 MAG: hypothetical protein UR83_C0052G0008 [Candidatus Moranbacteria bacterium GW2011_GWF2_35_54]